MRISKVAGHIRVTAVMAFLLCAVIECKDTCCADTGPFAHERIDSPLDSIPGPGGFLSGIFASPNFSIPPQAIAGSGGEQARQSAPVVPLEIDSTLRGSQEVIASTNLVPQPKASALKLEAVQDELLRARQYRREGKCDEAEILLTGILEREMPVEFQRSALLELALTAQDKRQLLRAQQVYSQYVQRYRNDPSVPEVLLRQGLLYREMGAPVLALSKFYSVMSTALSLKLDRLAYYQRLVLHSQTEIADTYYLQGKFEEAAEFFVRLLKLDDPALNRETVLYKLVRSSSGAQKDEQTTGQGKVFLSCYPESAHSPEVRFLLADALKRLGQKRAAIEEVLVLLKPCVTNSTSSQENWLYWQQRAGNEIANQLAQEGDYVNALQIYLRLAEINGAPDWRFPAWYQAALLFERLGQPQKADEMYTRILTDAKEPGVEQPSQSVALILQMSRWRKERLGWETRAELSNKEIIGAAAKGNTTN